MTRDLERRVAERAQRIAREGRHQPRLRQSWWNNRMLDWAMNHPSFRTQLFRFVDVFPATSDDDDVLEHLEQYFDEADVPLPVEVGVSMAERVPFGSRLASSVARRSIERLARQFIAGETIADAIEPLRKGWMAGSAFTVDLLGEHTLTEGEADAYVNKVSEVMEHLSDEVQAWPPNRILEHDHVGPLPRTNVSIKPSACTSRYAPLTADEAIAGAAARLRPVLETAAARGAFVWFDMESFDGRDLTQRLFLELLDHPSLHSLDAGIVVQAYLRDSPQQIEALLQWAGARERPIGVRLVKGAYWDSETIRARAAGWPSPVFARKNDTDANYELCTRLLLDNASIIRPAFGTHNLRSMAYAIEYARTVGLPDEAIEIELLFGMAEAVQSALAALGTRVRVYTPIGELLPGMAYLVRRLLENTANESFIRQRTVDARALDELIAPPRFEPEEDQPRDADAAGDDQYEVEPTAEWRRAPVRDAFAVAVARADRHTTRSVPAIIGGRRIMTDDTIASIDPGEPDRVVALSARCTGDHVAEAMRLAAEAWPAWRATPATERAAIIRRAGDYLRARRDDIAALEVFETGKPWSEADADVCEAIDFCRYYASEMERLDRGGVVHSPPGEHNELRYQPRGVGAVIAPWNFPLAIPTGMVTAALVTGNAVLFKPAEQSPAVGAQLVDALHAAGVPPNVLALLTGTGEEVGAAMVEHPSTTFVAFTGSKDVGLQIIERAAVHRPGQRQVKRVVAEMGGKNAMIIDSDADPDVAIPAVLASAFGYAGQKCSALSRLIVLDEIAEPFIARFVDATESLRIGHPRDMGVTIGPLIDEDAYNRVRRYIDIARHDGRIRLSRTDVPLDGYFVGPTIVDQLDSRSPVVTDEIFGPVVAVLTARSMEDALGLANDTDYALTGGIISRTPAHVRLVANELRAGNIYINRSITGAVVGRQPFGGYGMSGIGSKAGGPDYLLHFLDPRALTENTVRQGFAPPEDPVPATRAAL